MKPLAIDLFCGLGGWTEGLLAEGYDVIGFDIEIRPYSAQLVIQDVLTLHGSQFKDAALIVASPPCQEYSYMAMPWSRAKNIAKEYSSGVRDVARLKALFYACFRIQIEASHAASRYIPLVVENVRGAQPWVGQAKANYGSFYLWGDVGMVGRRVVGIRLKFGQGVAANHSKNTGGSWFNIAHNTASGVGNNPVSVPGGYKQLSPARRGKHYGETEKAALKGPDGGWFNDNKRNGNGPTGYLSQSGSKSSARKAASAEIAKIPFPLAAFIARTYYPKEVL